MDVGAPPARPEATASAADSWHMLHPNSLVVGRLAGAVTTGIIGIATFGTLVIATLGGGLATRGLLLLAGAGIIVILASAVATWIVPARRYEYTRYRIDDQGLLIRRGRLFRSEVAVLRSRIQHTDVTQGPIERAFGLGTLVVHTAGTSHAQIQLDGVAWDEARRLRTDLTGVAADDVV